ncbi:MAG: phosphoglycolate phosphatase [Burkholderiaceae bacterium]|jgi:phosphoglycolate phosphatase
MPMPYTAALLDLDGTLLDTIPDLAAAANAMLTDLGLATLPQTTLATFVGKGTANLVERTLAATGRCFSATQTRQALDNFHEHYRTLNGRYARLYDGALEGLQRFAKQGVQLAIVTNKPTEFTLPLLQKTGISALFDAVVCGDTCDEKKPHPMPFLHACTLLKTSVNQAVAIGDSVNDALAARAAGVAVLAVPYGYNEGRSVHELDVDAIVDSVFDAANWVLARNQTA